MVTARVLVVDDEPGMRLTLAASLELEGYEVLVAESGAKALELVKKHKFEAVVTDMKMPGMNGLETFRAIREEHPEMAVVLMTGFAMEALVEEGINEGAYTILRKPFSMDVIVKVLGSAIHSQGVLVVDDVPEAADTLAAALEAAGLRARVAHDGETAAQIVRDQEIDVCVLDLVMPGKDGVATAEAIRSIDEQVIVIAMTGYSVERLISAALAKGCYACLRKGFSVPDLIQTIARARARGGR